MTYITLTTASGEPVLVMLASLSTAANLAAGAEGGRQATLRGTESMAFLTMSNGNGFAVKESLSAIEKAIRRANAAARPEPITFDLDAMRERMEDAR